MKILIYEIFYRQNLCNKCLLSDKDRNNENLRMNSKEFSLEIYNNIHIYIFSLLIYKDGTRKQNRFSRFLEQSPLHNIKSESGIGVSSDSLKK